MRDGLVIKYQGSGSPRRKGTETDDDEEEDSMNDRSPIQSIQGDVSLDNDDRTSDQEEGMSKPTLRKLNQVRFFFAGNFQVDLRSWKEDILYNGGLVVFSIGETDVAVIPDQNNKADIQLLKEKGIPFVNLTDLHTVMEKLSLPTSSKHLAR
jgi:hypothetical protein